MRRSGQVGWGWGVGVGAIRKEKKYKHDGVKACRCEVRKGWVGA